MQGMLIDLLAELCGGADHGSSRGALLQQEAVPPELLGRSYGELFMHLSITRRLVALGLYRRKSENPGETRQRRRGESLIGGPAGVARAARAAYRPRPPCAPSLPTPPGTRLRYVVTNPPWHEPLEAGDRVFVLVERPPSPTAAAL